MASESVGVFHICFSFPPEYGYQIPIYLEIINDTTPKLTNYKIENDSAKPNKIINFTINPMEKNENILIHFSCWVIVENHNFSNIPEKIRFPQKCELPDEIKPSLSASEVVQVNNSLIRLKARELRGIQNNVVIFANRVAWFIKNHRFGLFLLELYLVGFFSQDALTTLFINGENVGRSHLACAMFRSQNIPARMILANNDQGFWTQMHYMVEYYLPTYGWVLLDSTAGKTPYETKRQVINRICYPTDENDTKNDYIFPLMKGEERWLWIDNDNLYPYYKDCEEGSRSQMFQESIVMTDENTSNHTLFLTKAVFIQYEYYLGMILIGDNFEHFQNAISYQQNALKTLATENNINEYIYFLDLANNEYMQINN
jgi:hypothetical protein